MSTSWLCKAGNIVGEIHRVFGYFPRFPVCCILTNIVGVPVSPNTRWISPTMFRVLPLFFRQMSANDGYYQRRRRSSSADTTSVRLIFETADRVIPTSNENDDRLASSYSESKLSNLAVDSSMSISEECMTR